MSRGQRNGSDLVERADSDYRGAEVASWQRPTRLGDYLNEAQRALDIGDWGEARVAAARAIGVSPTNAEAQSLFASAGQGLHHADGTKIRGERRQMTVMFCDLAHSTLLSGRWDPEAYRDVIAAYQAACDAVIDNFGGTTARFIGDGILAYFGWPEATDDDARRAAGAGLAIVEAVASLSDHMAADHGLPLEVRIGIDTGLVVVSDMGTDTSPDPNAIVGLTPNMASRLEGMAEPGDVVVGEVTNELVAGAFEVESLRTTTLRGVDRPTRIGRVVSRKNPPRAAR